MNGKRAKRLRKIAGGLAQKFDVPDEETGTRLQDNARVRRDKRALERNVKTSYKARRARGEDVFKIQLPRRLRLRRRPEKSKVDPVTTNNDTRISNGTSGSAGAAADRIRSATMDALRAAAVATATEGQADARSDRETPRGGEESDGNSADGTP